MAGQGLYARPVMCKFCDKVFDFPTLTTDIAEKDVPVKTRICRDCLWEMGRNEDLRERRAQAEEINRRSIASLSERTLPIMNSHKSSLSSVGTNDTSISDADMMQRSSGSPEQTNTRLLPRGSQPAAASSSLSAGRSSSEPRVSLGYRSILN